MFSGLANRVGPLCASLCLSVCLSLPLCASLCLSASLCASLCLSVPLCTSLSAPACASQGARKHKKPKTRHPYNHSAAPTITGQLDQNVKSQNRDTRISCLERAVSKLFLTMPPFVSCAPRDDGCLRQARACCAESQCAVVCAFPQAF